MNQELTPIKYTIYCKGAQKYTFSCEFIDNNSKLIFIKLCEKLYKTMEAHLKNAKN